MRAQAIPDRHPATVGVFLLICLIMGVPNKTWPCLINTVVLMTIAPRKPQPLRLRKGALWVGAGLLATPMTSCDYAAKNKGPCGKRELWSVRRSLITWVIRTWRQSSRLVKSAGKPLYYHHLRVRALIKSTQLLASTTVAVPKTTQFNIIWFVKYLFIPVKRTISIKCHVNHFFKSANKFNVALV